MDDNLLQGEEQVIDENQVGNEPGLDDTGLENQNLSETGSDPTPSPTDLQSKVDLLVQQNQFLAQQIEAIKSGVQPGTQQQTVPQKDPIAEILESIDDEDLIDKKTFGNVLQKVVETITEKNKQASQQTEEELALQRVRDSEARMIQEVPEFTAHFKKYLAQDYFNNPKFRDYIDSHPDPARKAWELIQKEPAFRQEQLQKKAQLNKQTPNTQEKKQVTTTGMGGTSVGQKDYENMSLAEIRAESDRVIRGR